MVGDQPMQESIRFKNIAINLSSQFKKQQSKYEIIDLTGPQGNAHYLMGRAIVLSKQLGIDSDSIIQNMKSGDYDNLIKVFDKHFGSFVVLER